MKGSGSDQIDSDIVSLTVIALQSVRIFTGDMDYMQFGWDWIQRMNSYPAKGHLNVLKKKPHRIKNKVTTVVCSLQNNLGSDGRTCTPLRISAQNDTQAEAK